MSSLPSNEHAYGSSPMHHQRVWVVSSWETALGTALAVCCVTSAAKDNYVAHLRGIGNKRILVRCIVFKYSKEK